MKKAILALFLLFALASAAPAQQGNTVTRIFPGAPTGTCGALQFAVNGGNGDLYDCVGTSWVKVGTGGGGGTIGGTIALDQMAGGSGANTIGPAGSWVYNADGLSVLGCFNDDSCGIEMAGMTSGSSSLFPGNLFIDDTGGFNGLSYNAGSLTIGDNMHVSGSITLRNVTTGNVTWGEVDGKEFNTNGAGIMTSTSSNTDLNGTITASGGTASYSFTRTFAIAPICIARDETTLASLLSVSVNTTTLTVTTAGMTDHVSFICVGRS